MGIPDSRATPEDLISPGQCGDARSSLGRKGAGGHTCTPSLTAPRRSSARHVQAASTSVRTEASANSSLIGSCDRDVSGMSVRSREKLA